jgi:GT2 family glycosyltransferase
MTGYTPEVSIIIPVHNEGQRLFLTLEALPWSTDVRFEVIVVDDGSTDRCCDFLRAEPALFPNIRLLSGNRGGAAAARNAGAKQARSPVLLFLDAHCFPAPGWLEKLLAVLDNMGEGVVAPCVSVAGNAVSKGYGLTVTNREFAVQWLPKTMDTPYEIPIAGAGCMMMKADFFRAIRGFESMRTYGVEEVELCIRCWRLGYPVLLEPNAEVAHCFKERINFEVEWPDYLCNLLRTAILHFRGEQLTGILNHLQLKPGFPESAARLVLSDIWDRYCFIQTMSRHDTDWFCRKFSIEI